MMWRRLSGVLVFAFLTCCAGSSSSLPSTLVITPPGASPSFTIYAFGNASGLYGLPVSPANDGAQPKGTLTLVTTGASPMLFGRTAAGGNSTTCGAFFDMNPASPSSYSVIYRFSGSDGCSPRHDAMVLNDSGLLYSTTQGVNNDGVAVNNGDIVTVTPATAAVNIFHQFAGQPSDGSQQHSSFSFDASGNTFGMSADGGTKDKGFLYYIPAGSSTPIGLHNFKKSDGEDPHGR